MMSSETMHFYIVSVLLVRKEGDYVAEAGLSVKNVFSPNPEDAKSMALQMLQGEFSKGFYPAAVLPVDVVEQMEKHKHALLTGTALRLGGVN